MRIITLGLALLVAALAANADGQDCSKAPKAAQNDIPIAVGFGDQWVTGAANVFELGLQRQGAEITGELTVCNTGTTELTLDVFTFGENTLALWKRSAELKTRTILPAGQSNVVNVRTVLEKTYDEPLFVVSNEGQVLTRVFVHYLTTDTTEKTRTVEYGGIQSGFSEKWSPWYQICAGQSPLGYTLDPSKQPVLILTGSGDHGRRCGYWSQCRIDQKDESDVCYGFTVQGHHFSANLFHGDEDEFVQVIAHLEVHYTLAHPEFKLLPLDMQRPSAGPVSPSAHR